MWQYVAIKHREGKMPSTTTAAPASTSNGAAEKDPRYVAVTMTPPLLEALRKAAGTEQSLSGYIRTVLAQHLGITIEAAPSARQKYNTEEERKAAQVKQRKDRQALIAQLLAEHKAKLAAQATSDKPAPAPAA